MASGASPSAIEGGGPALRLQDLTVRLNDGTAVLDDTDVTIMPGERVLIAGESGTGKSTLVRAIAGLWPWGGGSIEVKKGAKIFLLPQRPYVPIGTLRRAATYPDAPESRSIEDVADAFKRVGLEHLIDKLDEEGPWDQTLSGGEKQRLAFARILLHNPDIVVLDEATAALDPKSQDKLMELLLDRPDTTLLSVGHRPELEAFHTRKIVLARRRGGAKLVHDVDLPAEPLHRVLWRWLRRGPGRSRRATARVTPCDPSRSGTTARLACPAGCCSCEVEPLQQQLEVEPLQHPLIVFSTADFISRRMRSSSFPGGTLAAPTAGVLFFGANQTN